MGATTSKEARDKGVEINVKKPMRNTKGSIKTS